MASKYILGVDVGTSCVKVLAATRKNGHIHIYGNGSAPTAGFAKGVVTDAGRLAAAIRTAISSAVGSGADTQGGIYLGIGGMDITSQNSIGGVAPASSGAVNAGDIERACRAATIVSVPDDHRILHVLPIGFWLDGRPEPQAPVGGKGARLDVEAHIVSIPRSTADELLAALAAEGISVAGLMANAVASASVLAESPRSCLIADIGAGLTDLALFNEGRIVMSASVPLGGDYITTDIMHGLDVERPHAEEIKHYYARLDDSLLGRDVMLDCIDSGADGNKIAYDFLHKIVDSRVEEIVSLLYAYLEPALTRYGAEKILLTGGSAHLPAIGAWLENLFTIPVDLAQPGVRFAAEYTHPAVTASVGIVEYAARLAPAVPEDGALRAIFRKLREFI